MPNNIAVSITADVADLQVKRAILSAELKTATKDLNDFARTAKSGMTDELKAQMLAAADAAQRSRNQIGLVDSELRKLGVGAAAAHAGTSGVTRELIVLAREAGRGNFSRMAGSATILAQRMGLLEAVLNPVSLAVVGMVAAVGAAVVATAVYDGEQQKLIATLVGVGAASGLSAQQMQAAATSTARASGQSTSTAIASAEAFAAAGVRSQDAIRRLIADVQVYAALTGEKTPEAQKALAEAMRDPAKGAETLNAQLGILDATTLEHIRSLTAAGEKEEAVAVLVAALDRRFGEAQAAGVRVNGTFDDMGGKLKDLIEGFGKLTQQIGMYNAEAANPGVIDAIEAQHKAQSRARGQAQNEAQLNQASDAGRAAYDKTPEGEDQKRLQALKDSLNKAGTAVAADTKLHGEHSDAVARDARTVAEYKRAVDTFLPSAEKAHQIAQLDAQIALARQGHNQAEVESLTRRRALVQSAGEVMSPEEAAQKANDAATLAADKTRAPKGPGIVQQWTEEFRAAQVRSKAFFDDEAQAELDFWNQKVKLTDGKGKEWLEVQGKIYEASKALAHQDYQDHLADLNDRIEADRDNWAKEQADWQEKLAYIASKFGEQSREYKAAHKELEAAEQEHQRQMAEVQRAGAADQFNALKAQLDANKTIRNTEARTAESGIQANARYSPFGEIQAAQQIAAIHRQNTAQDLADEQTLQAAKMRQMDQDIAATQQGSAAYLKAVQAKEAADQEWSQKLRTLSAQAAAQQAADQQKIASAWHATIDPMVSSVGNQFKGLIEGTETWQQALLHIGEDALGVVINAIERMVEAWIVGMVTGQAAQSTTAAAQVASYAGIAGAAGVASMAGAPFPVDLTAPAFGAAMASTAMAFGTMASLAVGTNEVPADMVAQIHEGERVIPAADNRALMAAVNGGANGVRGDTHNHITYAPQVTSKGSFKDDLRQNAAHLYDVIRAGFRNGSLSFD